MRGTRAPGGSQPSGGSFGKKEPRALPWGSHSPLPLQTPPRGQSRRVLTPAVEEGALELQRGYGAVSESQCLCVPGTYLSLDGECAPCPEGGVCA